MAVLTVSKIPVIFLVMFALGLHRVQTFKLNNEVPVLSQSEGGLSFLDTDYSVESDQDSSHRDPSSYHSMEDDHDDHDDYSDFDDDDHDDDDDASSIELSFLQPESADPDDPDFVPSEIDLTNNSPSSSSDDYESEDPVFVPSEIDLTNNSSSASPDDYYESEDPDFVPSEIDLTNNSPSSSSDDYESDDPNFVPSEIDLAYNSDDYDPMASSDNHDPEDQPFYPSDYDLTDKSSTSSVDYDSEGSNPSKELKERAKDKTSKNRPGKQWGGSPSPQRLNEIRQADTEYFDLYLCGQFLDITDDDTDRFAVMGFNYAGRSQPFLPCQNPLSARETVNYLYRTQTDGPNAFQQVVHDLPATWHRYMAEKGSAPKTVHIFTFNAPGNVADVAQFLQLRNSEPYSSARFILGYVNQKLEMETGDVNPSDSGQDFIHLLDELKRARVDAVRVCGRCLKVAGYPVGGRRRNTMRYGMSALPWPTNSQCRTDQEVNIPGADFSGKTCKSFQKSIAKCVLRSLDRRFSINDDVGDNLSGEGANKALQRKLGDVTRLCVRDKRCWRRQSSSIRDLYMPSVVIPDSPRRGGTKFDFGKILERCASGASELPFDIL